MTKDYEFASKLFGWREDFHWVQRTFSYEIANILHAFYLTVTFRRKEISTPSTILEGEWPVCPKCLRLKTVRQCVGHAIVLAGLGLIMIILAGIQMSAFDHLPAPLIAGLFPGWFPFGLLLAILIYRHSGNLVPFRPITEYTEVTIKAHPRFADVVESRGTTTEIHEW
ncbi:hypothetical protein [Nocardia nova]|uniref:hypothetical protein n=1 Tax=Nocardia nova TaxID=37330 RepID=UPI0011DE3708|nr:hypothetical protein [Nocardia nova]